MVADTYNKLTTESQHLETFGDADKKDWNAPLNHVLKINPSHTFISAAAKTYDLKVTMHVNLSGTTYYLTKTITIIHPCYSSDLQMELLYWEFHTYYHPWTNEKLQVAFDWPGQFKDSRLTSPGHNTWNQKIFDPE